MATKAVPDSLKAVLKAAPFEVEPIDASFGAYVRNVELRSITDDAFQMLYSVWLEYALLVFEDQFLTRDEQNEFAARFGSLEFAATAISNVGKDGKLHNSPDDDVVKSLRGNEGWHHDSTYMPLQAKGAVFTAEVVPSEGAATGWADMRAAYEALDADTQEYLAGLKAHHSLQYSQGRMGYLPTQNKDGGYDMYGYHDADTPLRSLVKVHPETGKPNLLIGRHAHDIVGMTSEESTELLDKLNADACQSPRTYHQQWKPGEAVVWDNRRLMHRGTPFDMTQRRIMWHARIAGDTASELADNHTSETSEAVADDPIAKSRNAFSGGCCSPSPADE